jgi:hypothetical protein
LLTQKSDVAVPSKVDQFAASPTLRKYPRSDRAQK